MPVLLAIVALGLALAIAYALVGRRGLSAHIPHSATQPTVVEQREAVAGDTRTRVIANGAGNVTPIRKPSPEPSSEVLQAARSGEPAGKISDSAFEKTLEALACLGVTKSKMDEFEGKERRHYPRIKAQVSVELGTGEDAPPSRVSTAEISVGGCYIETMFTLDVGTRVFLTLWLKEQAIRTTAIVATRHPQVGNGFQFIDISPEDRPKLNEFISGLETR